MSEWVVLERLLIITVIAGAIGFERERHGRAAGFRTHILVGVGSCLVMLTGLYLMEEFPGIGVEPSRMAAQVVSGIGFLGAGTILRYRTSIRGLTTAASLWAIGGVGIASGAGFLWGAVFAGLIVIITLFGLERLEQGMRKEQFQMLVLEMDELHSDLPRVRGLLAEYELEIRDLDVKKGEQPGRVRFEFHVRVLPDQPQDEIADELKRAEGVVDARWV